MTDQEIEALIDPALAEVLDGHGFQGTDVRSGDDHDGEPALFIDVLFGASRSDWTSAAIIMMKQTILSLLRHAGDARFPYVTFQLDAGTSAEDQKKIVHDLLRA